MQEPIERWEAAREAYFTAKEAFDEKRKLAN
jgi:hypothetical protein